MPRSLPDNDRLPHALYRAAQVRALDRVAIEGHGIPGLTLMRRAGEAAFNLLRRRWPAAQRILVICGIGNNAGDGYVVAKLAHAAGLQASVVQLGDPGRLAGDALTCADAYRAAGGEIEGFEQLPARCDLIVDAVFGTGLEREVVGRWRDALEAVNTHRAPVLALDIPSGLHADSGAVMGVAVRAAATVSFIGLKRGLYTGQGPGCCGEIRFESLQVPAAIYASELLSARRIDWQQQAQRLAPRDGAAHKGDFGHLLVVGGERGLSGAARLAGEAGARAGAGLVSIATRVEHAAMLNLVRPELMVHGVEEPAALAPLLRRATVAAVGPGLGQGAWGRALLGQLLQTRLPLVVDADALNLLAQDPAQRDDWVLTPHPGEAARLLGCSTAEVQVDRFAAIEGLQRRYGGVVVLKGAGTLVWDGSTRPPAVCSDGNPGMASGGMGDLLTGLIAALIAQGFTPAEAAECGVCLHAAAADAAAGEGGERGLLASDLLPWLPRLGNPESRC